MTVGFIVKSSGLRSLCMLLHHMNWSLEIHVADEDPKKVAEWQGKMKQSVFEVERNILQPFFGLD